MNAHTPIRFQAPCVFCQDTLDIRQPGVYQLTVGWVKNRKEGGGNAVALPERYPQWSCPTCMDSKLHGTAAQASLFG